MRISITSKLAAGVAAASLLVGGGAAAVAAASSSTSGTVHIWVSPSATATEKILLTGVIGDYGTATTARCRVGPGDRRCVTLAPFARLLERRPAAWRTTDVQTMSET